MFDVLIVGAGLSGLTTAYKIHQKEPSLKLKILEASDTIGGHIASPFETETAKKFVTAEQYHIHSLLKELSIPLRRRTPVSKNLKRSWAIDIGRCAFIAKFELQRYMDDLDLKSQLFYPGTYELTPTDRKNSIWHHIHGKLFFESSRKFMTNFVQLVTGVSAKEICYVEFMNVLHSCGGCKTLMDLYIDSPPTLLEFPSEELLEALESSIQNVDLEKMSKVIEIQHNNNYVQVRDINGSVHSAEVVVLAIPWNKIVDIFITPRIPSELQVPYPGNSYYITSFNVQYNEAHWRQKGLSGNLYHPEPAIYVQQHKPTSLSGYILHEEGLELISKSIILEIMAKVFGSKMLDPIEYSQQTFEQTSLLNLPETIPWNRIVWSSTSTSTLYRGCLSGAVQSGIRAALSALLIIRPQNVTWQDLAELKRTNIFNRYPGCRDLFKSSLNVYNTVFYTTTVLVLYLAVKNRNKILNLT